MRRLSFPWQGMLLVNVATFTWATNIVLGRALRHTIGPVTLAALRFWVAVLVFYLLLRWREPHELRLKGDGRLLLGMGLTGIALFVPVMYLGLRYTTAVNTVLIAALGPFVTGMWATLLLREPMTRHQALAASVALVGVAWLVTQGKWEVLAGLRFNPGDLLVLVAVNLWGIYSVLGKKAMRRRSPLAATAWAAFLAVPWLTLMMPWEMRVLPVAWSPMLAAVVVYLGVVPSVVGFAAWSAGVKMLGPSGAMVFYNVLPLYGALLGALFLGEALTPAHLVGGALIVAAGVWAGLHARAG